MKKIMISGTVSENYYWPQARGKHGKADIFDPQHTGNVMFYPDNQDPFYRCCMPKEDFIPDDIVNYNS